MFRSLLLSVLLLSFTMKTSAAAVILVQKGQPTARIFVLPTALLAPTMPGPKKPQLMPETPLAMAVREWNYHLQKMSGTTLKVVPTTDVKSITGPAIVLGDLAVQLGATPQKTSESQEGFRVLARGQQLLIGGQSDQAALLGTYEALEKLGCDWVMPGAIGEVIPHLDTVSFPEMDTSQAPDFLVRRLGFRGGSRLMSPEESARGAEWLRRQRGNDYDHPVIQTSGHIWDQFIKKHQAEFDKDPTMYALRRMPDGTFKRTGPQLESTHPHVIELFAQDIRDAYAKNGWPKDKVAGFGIGPADGLGYSMSAESLGAGSGRIDPISGELDRTDEVILLGNRILEKLGPEYPNVHLGFYSYSVHADFPMRYKPNPRIAIIFAPISFSRFHSLTDANSKSQAYYKSIVEEWAKLSKEQGNWLLYRGYNWNLAENMLPYTKLQIWGEELPFYKQHGFLGLNVEATKAWSVNGPSDWLFMKLAWNSNQDWKVLLSDYCRKSFGTGAAPMERYFLRLAQTQHDAGQEAGSYHAYPLIFDTAFISAGEADFREALQNAQTPEQKTRVQIFANNLQALKLYLAYFEATENFDFPVVKQDYDAMLAHWQQQNDANSDLVAKEVPQYLTRYITQFVEQGLKYSTGDYKIVEKLPDALPTIFDPLAVGERLNYHRPEINDANFEKTKTYSSTWDAQGLSGLRSGAVWYRHHFAVPAGLKGQAVGLFLGGFEDEARVWINGQLVGTSGPGFSKPAEFDLTDDLHFGSDNLLAIQIVRNSATNEIGLGGLIRPSFLFSGPRLATKAPKPLELRRVLPGGELGEVEK